MLTSMINHAMYVCIQRHSSMYQNLKSVSVRFICDLWTWTYTSKIETFRDTFYRGCALIMEGTEAPLTSKWRCWLGRGPPGSSVSAAECSQAAV